MRFPFPLRQNGASAMDYTMVKPFNFGEMNLSLKCSALGTVSKEMKKMYAVVFVVSFLVCLAGLPAVDFRDFDCYQDKRTYEEVEKKIKNCLEKNPEIRGFYRLTPQALYIGDLDRQEIDCVLYLKRSGPDIFHERPMRKKLKGARIAIDPGHFGGAFAELEERFIKIPASKTKNNREIYFAEGDLAYLTAIELQSLLEAEGAIVFISRAGIGRGVIEEDFFSWKEKHLDLQAESASKLFRAYYNAEDLRKRAEKINDFSPDIAIIIHYNADAADPENAFFTQSNYSLAFIPGAFGSGELKRKEDRYEFLRLLLTDTVEDSLELSGYIVQEFVRHLDVPLIAQNDTAPYIEKACLFQAPGVYCRNLTLTRLIHGPVCYGETLIQNHEEEAYRLASCDVSIMETPCSSRIKQVARAYFEGIKQYFNLPSQ